jgi:hypothetical protein
MFEPEKTPPTKAMIAFCLGAADFNQSFRIVTRQHRIVVWFVCCGLPRPLSHQSGHRMLGLRTFDPFAITIMGLGIVVAAALMLAF